MFRSLLHDHPQGSSFVLGALPLLRGEVVQVRKTNPEDGHTVMTETGRV
jgi:hypothetical protein